MPDRSSDPAPAPLQRSLARLVAHSLESSDLVAAQMEESRQDLAGRESNRRLRNLAVSRTHTALTQTESVLAQTARSLQRTAGLLSPQEP